MKNEKLICEVTELYTASIAALDKLMHIAEHYGHDLCDEEVRLLREAITKAEGAE